MSLLGKIFGVVPDMIDDKAERIFACRVGLACIILAATVGGGILIMALRCH